MQRLTNFTNIAPFSCNQWQTPFSNTLNWKQTLPSRNSVTVFEYSTAICPTKTDYLFVEIWQCVLYFISSKQKPFNPHQILPLWGSRGWGEEYAKIKKSTNIAPFSFFHMHDCFDNNLAKEMKGEGSQGIQ